MAYNLLLVASIALALIFQSEADLVDNLCSQAGNPSLCNQVLRSNPRSKGADLTGLGEIIVEKGQAAVGAAIDVVKSAPPSGGIKGALDDCVGLLTDSIGYLKACVQKLKSHDKNGLSDRVAAALTNIAFCDNELRDSGGEPPNVKEADRKAVDIIQVLLVISRIS